MDSTYFKSVITSSSTREGSQNRTSILREKDVAEKICDSLLQKAFHQALTTTSRADSDAIRSTVSFASVVHPYRDREPEPPLHHSHLYARIGKFTHCTVCGGISRRPFEFRGFTSNSLHPARPLCARKLGHRRRRDKPEFSPFSSYGMPPSCTPTANPTART